MTTYLEERIKWYDDNYRAGNALISDAQFDKLECNLFRVNPKAEFICNIKSKYNLLKKI